MIKRLSVFFLLTVFAVRAEVRHLRVCWNSDPASTATLLWHEDEGDFGTFRYRVKGAKEWIQKPTEAYEYQEFKVKRVRLDHLPPDASIELSVKVGEQEEQRWFQTVSQNISEVHFVAGGDSRKSTWNNVGIGKHRKIRQNANRMVAHLRPDFIAFVGDCTQRSSNDAWARWFDDWVLTEGSDGRLTPLIMARGNHEEDEDLENLFGMPKRDPQDVYALSFGQNLLRLYTLNSMIPRGGSQVEWLRQDLSDHAAARWKIVQYHHPIRPHRKDKEEQEEQYQLWAPLFFQHQVQLAIECDSHLVKRTFPIRPTTAGPYDPTLCREEGFVRDDRGTVFIGEGAWGAPLRSNDDNKCWTQGSAKTWEFNWIHVDSKALEVRTLLIEEADRLLALERPTRENLPEKLLWKPARGERILRIPAQKP